MCPRTQLESIGNLWNGRKYLQITYLIGVNIQNTQRTPTKQQREKKIYSLIEKAGKGNVSDGALVKILHFNCRGHRFNPSLGN